MYTLLSDENELYHVRFWPVANGINLAVGCQDLVLPAFETLPRFDRFFSALSDGQPLTIVTPGKTVTFQIVAPDILLLTRDLCDADKERWGMVRLTDLRAALASTLEEHKPAPPPAPLPAPTKPAVVLQSDAFCTDKVAVLSRPALGWTTHPLWSLFPIDKHELYLRMAPDIILLDTEGNWSWNPANGKSILPTVL